MKLLILSDLHLECAAFDLPTRTGADVCVLAGDICSPTHYGRLQRMLAKWRMPTVVVHGNHDLWYDQCGPAMQPSLQLRGLLADLGDNFHLLECGHVDIGDVRFAGGTLWSDFKIAADPEAAKKQAQSGINDFAYIGVADGLDRRRLCADDLVAGHRRCVDALRKSIDTAPGDVVMVTHFLPSAQSIDPQFANHPLNAYFASDIEHLMGGKVKLAIHGHTHTSADYIAHGTRVVCNPRGYSYSGRDSENPCFDARRVVRI